jgi:hypothetical protein
MLMLARLRRGGHAENPQAAAEPDEPVAEVRGVNVHAKQRVDGRDRKQLERLNRGPNQRRQQF